MAEELDAMLAALVAPLETERESIENSILEIEAKLHSLREDRNRLDGILRRVNGTPSKPGPKPGQKLERKEWQRPSAETMDRIREILSQWEGREEFTRSALFDHAKAQGVAISFDTLSRVTLTMHDEGELRLLAKTGRSGGKIYRYLGSTN